MFGRAILLLELVVNVQAAGPPILSKWASRTPLIDGYISRAHPNEWGDAEKIDFVLSWGVEAHNASLYVKNDYINLYLAFVIEDEDFDLSDRVAFNFDNDNDGEKEIGDDQLWIETSIHDDYGGLFKDGFFPTPSDAPTWSEDALSGGTQDGVGAVQFTGYTPSSLASYVFEVAHPLNTADDGHDFSLGVGVSGVGDTVGINVIYQDAGADMAGWPTLTWGDWSQMASIQLADNPNPPPRHPSRNLQIANIEITQAIQYCYEGEEGKEDNSLPLVYGKSTIVRVYLDLGMIGFPFNDSLTTHVTVYLYATSSTGHSLVQSRSWGAYGPSAEALLVPYLKPSFLHRENDRHTANFLLPSFWVSRGSLNLVAFAKISNAESETSYADNWMSRRTFSFLPTNSLKIGYYLIDYRPTAPDPSPNVPNNTKAVIAYKFFEKVTPMPDLSDPIDYYYVGTFPWEGPAFVDSEGEFDSGNQAELLLELIERWESLAMEGELYDQICGLYANADTSIGQAGGLGLGPMVFVAHEDRPWSFAHEIGHNFGFSRRHSWVDDDNPYVETLRENSSQTYGYDTQKNWFVTGNENPSELTNVVKTPLGPPHDGLYGSLMSYENRRRWISPYEWNKLFEVFDPPAEGLGLSTFSATESYSSGIRVTGMICRNNTGSLRPIFQVPFFLNSTVPDGPFTVELRGSPPGEPLLYSQSFNVSFEPDGDWPLPADRAFFMLNLPYMSETYSVSLWNTSITPYVLLDKITASASPPQVTITYPNGGESVGDSFNATWTAFDADGDPLTFRLYYSNDNGASWRPLSPRTAGTSYPVDTSALPGGSEGLLRVEVSDGFHMGADLSDGAFLVPLKIPTDLLSYAQDAVSTEPYLETARSRYSIRSHDGGGFTIFKGYAFDAEDGVLQDSALSWASDVEGVLGTGRVLEVVLSPGTHNITFTATDSHGNNATDWFMVTVEIHNLVVAQGSTDRVNAYQGQTVNANFTVANEGNMNETFKVFAYALSKNLSNPDVAIGNQSVIDLTPNSNITLTFNWNTTNVALGNYTISCYAAPVVGELYTSDNYWIIPYNILCEHFPWDVTGDGYVGIDDIVAVAEHFGQDPGDPQWDPKYDINDDNYVGIDDIVATAEHFGESA